MCIQYMQQLVVCPFAPIYLAYDFTAVRMRVNISHTGTGSDNCAVRVREIFDCLQTTSRLKSEGMKTFLGSTGFVVEESN